MIMDENQARNRRLDQLFNELKRHRITRLQVAEAIGVDSSLFSNIINDRLKNNLTLDVANLICDKVVCDGKKISLDWLYNGQGEMFVQISNSQSVDLFSSNNVNNYQTDNYEKKTLPKIEQNFSENVNFEQKSEKKSPEQQIITENVIEKIIEKVVEGITEKQTDKKIKQILVFYDNGTFEEVRF